MAEPCAFCEIVARRAPAERVPAEGLHSIGIVPLRPVTPGHVLFISPAHVRDAAGSPWVTAEVFADAARWARQQARPFNLITSAGAEATQTVPHLHVHYVPRTAGDGLPLPWTGQREREILRESLTPPRLLSGVLEQHRQAAATDCDERPT